MAAEEPERRRASLSFLSGRCQGSEYVLDDPAEVIVGRTSEAELVLQEGLVSRRHARFTLANGLLAVEDLGSTNGTFVNGQRIRSAQLREGDRILIGTSIVKVRWTNAPPTQGPPAPAVRRTPPLDKTQPGDASWGTGRLHELPVAELLELLATMNRTASVVLHHHRGATGVIVVQQGAVEDARLDGLDHASARKCIERMLGWAAGDYSLQPYEKPAHGARLGTPVPELLAQTLFDVDECSLLRAKLGGPDATLVLARPLGPKLRDLDSSELEVLQAAHNLARVDDVLDAAPETDLTTTRRLLSLLERGYLRRG